MLQIIQQNYYISFRLMWMNVWMSCTTALMGASRRYRVPQPNLVCMRSRWLACCLSTILIILIQQPEPSGSEARESRVRNKGRKIWPTKHLTHAAECDSGMFDSQNRCKVSNMTSCQDTPCIKNFLSSRYTSPRQHLCSNLVTHYRPSW
jgi:hypothetical protein